jgi:hypothetical protein
MDLHLLSEINRNGQNGVKPIVWLAFLAAFRLESLVGATYKRKSMEVTEASRNYQRVNNTTPTRIR